VHAMTSPSAPAGATPQRRTRIPDRLTDLVLVVTAVFGVWGVVLIVLTFIGITRPAFLYSDPKIAVKVLGATVVALLALGQVYTMETVLGHLPRGTFKMRTLLRVHRYSGRIAIVLAALIAYFCITDVGAPRAPVRVFIHAVFGATAFSVLGIKFYLIRFRPTVAYKWAPWFGRIIAICFVIIWITSGLAWMTNSL
jgi:hypothetical protein